MAKAKAKEKIAATVIIKDGDKMTKAGRKRIAEWLRGRADLLIEHGDNLNSTFTSRYYYSPS